MEFWLFCIVGVLTIVVVVLLCIIFSFRYSVREIVEELNEKMSADTNTLISISSADICIRRLAIQLNIQLKALRQERLRLQNGDAELKSAVTNISHDLRTPLTAISGHLDLLDDVEKSPEVERHLSIIRERTEALKVLTGELFQYSVITSASDQMTLEDVSLNAVLEESLAAFYATLTEHGITPDIQMPERTVIRRLDRTALRRIIDNILNNAAKYSDGDLSVVLTPYGMISFSNTAKSLSKVQIEKLFDRFFTVESARNSTGLGLSIAKLLTEKIGGKIKAEYIGDKLIITIFLKY